MAAPFGSGATSCTVETNRGSLLLPVGELPVVQQLPWLKPSSLASQQLCSVSPPERRAECVSRRLAMARALLSLRPGPMGSRARAALRAAAGGAFCSPSQSVWEISATGESPACFLTSSSSRPGVNTCVEGFSRSRCHTSAHWR